MHAHFQPFIFILGPHWTVFAELQLKSSLFSIYWHFMQPLIRAHLSLNPIQIVK